jgi:hypothetical protein
VVVATEVVATEAEVTLAEVIPEDSTEAGCQQQVVPAAGRRLQVRRAWPAITPEAGCQQQVVPVKQFSTGRRLRVAPAWPTITVVHTLHRLAAESRLFAVPRQVAMEVRQIRLQTRTETQLRKERNRPWTAHRNGVRPRTIEGIIGTGGGTRMIGA